MDPPDPRHLKGSLIDSLTLLPPRQSPSQWPWRAPDATLGYKVDVGSGMYGFCMVFVVCGALSNPFLVLIVVSSVLLAIAGAVVVFC